MNHDPIDLTEYTEVSDLRKVKARYLPFFGDYGDLHEIRGIAHKIKPITVYMKKPGEETVYTEPVIATMDIVTLYSVAEYGQNNGFAPIITVDYQGLEDLIQHLTDIKNKVKDGPYDVRSGLDTYADQY